jgi:uncharacterized protein YcbK (DUF882 family)
VAYAFLHAPSATQPAIADGDTRTLTFINNHTNESGSFTYLVNGAYDQATLDKLNWFLRDWRLNEQIKMDPHLFDILWDVYRQSGSNQPIDVLSGYRSPQTNSMLRRRSRQVAEHSQHMQGKAIDAHFIDIKPGPIRDIAMRMQEGGVGFYPIGSTPWVHIDSGTVRYWPRMSRSALARLFPDGKTVLIPADGQPMDGYAEAKAMIETRGGAVQTASSSGGLFGWLFGGARGGGADDEEESGGAPVIAAGRGGLSVMAVAGRGVAAPAVVAEAAPPSSPPPVAAAAEATTPESEAVTGAETEPPSASDASAGDAEIAPVPPRKPLELLAALNTPPVPPKRPPEWAILSESTVAAPSRNDLIAAMIEQKSLPSAIIGSASVTPNSALALADGDGRSGGGVSDALARAAALAWPPLPPRRPVFKGGGVTSIEKTPPIPPQRPTKALQGSAANPWGSLVVDAFNGADPSSTAGKPNLELHGTNP